MKVDFLLTSSSGESGRLLLDRCSLGMSYELKKRSYVSPLGPTDSSGTGAILLQKTFPVGKWVMER